MFLAKHLLILTLLLAVSNPHFEASGDDPLGGVKPAQNDSECETSCQQPTPPSGYPAYVAPPLLSPPPPSPPLPGYSIYSAPPPPHKSGQSKCPPAPGAPYTPPYGTYYGPPNPYYTYGPPNVYTPVTYGQGTRSASQILPILAPVLMLFSSFIFVI